MATIKRAKDPLSVTHPDLAKEWDYNKNDPLTPDNVLPKSNKKAWWICDKGHKWEAVVASRSSGSGCPYCSGRLIISGINDLATTNPILTSEWNYEKNNNLRPEIVSPNSHKRMWWICSKCGNEWLAEIKSRNSGTGCPKCGLKKLSAIQRENNLKAKGSLMHNNPELAKEWHPFKNGTLTPNDVLTGSNIKVWWLGKCGHEWESVVSSRQTGCGCPKCGYKQSAITRNNTKIQQGFSLATVNPLLSKEWHPTKNGELTPNDVLAGSSNMVWWVCRKGHEWQAVISSRNEGVGCPICTNERKTSFPEQAILYYFSKFYKVKGRYQYKKKEIDVYIPLLSTGIEYDGRFFHDSDKSSLRDKAKTEFLIKHGIKLIRIREAEQNYVSNNIIFYKYDNRYSELPWAIQSAARLIDETIRFDINLERDKTEIYEQYINLEKHNSLAIMFPEITKEWNYEKNGTLSPETIPSSSNKKLWWKCKQGHEWQAVVSSRTNGCGCPFCAGKKAILGVNDLATVNPTLANEWDYEKNAPLTPNDVLSKSNKKVGWICSNCGYKWMTQVSNRTRGRCCPQCAKDSQVKTYLNNRIAKSGSLAQNNPKLASEWHPDKNGSLSPSDVMTGTNRKVWWLGECGHEWEALISSRALNNTGCPFCSGRRGNRVKCIETGRIYLSFSDAAADTGINASTISLCCRGKQKTSGGFHWIYE